MQAPHLCALAWQCAYALVHGVPDRPPPGYAQRLLAGCHFCPCCPICESCCPLSRGGFGRNANQLNISRPCPHLPTSPQRLKVSDRLWRVLARTGLLPRTCPPALSLALLFLCVDSAAFTAGRGSKIDCSSKIVEMHEVLPVTSLASDWAGRAEQALNCSSSLWAWLLCASLTPTLTTPAPCTPRSACTQHPHLPGTGLPQHCSAPKNTIRVENSAVTSPAGSGDNTQITNTVRDSVSALPPPPW